MKKLTFLLLLISVFFCTAQQQTTSIDTVAIEKLIIQTFNEKDIVGASIIIVKNGKVFYEKGFGLTKNSGAKMTPKTSSGIASMTKSFTGFAIMQLSERGLIDLDEKVINYLPNFKTSNINFSRQITIRNLLYHSSGFSQLNGNRSWNWADMNENALDNVVSDYQNVKLKSQPNENPQYSNANYHILGLIIEKVSKQPYEKYVKENILDPLEMGNTFFGYPNPVSDDIANPNRLFFGFATNHSHNPRLARNFYPVGGLYSSAEDMGKYLIAVMERDTSLVSKNGFDQIFKMDEKQRTNHGEFGWVRGYGKSEFFYHAGQFEGIESNMLIIPSEQIGLVVLSNTFGGNYAVNRINSLINGPGEILLGYEPPKNFNLIESIIFWTMSFLPIAFVILIVRILFRRKKAIKSKSNWKIIIPILIFITLTYILIFYIPRQNGIYISGLLNYMPDVGFLLVITTILSFVWAVLKIQRTIIEQKNTTANTV